MAHPFFEASEYPWWLTPESTDFHTALAKLIPVQARIDVLYRACGANLPNVFLGQAQDLVWREVLNNLTPLGGLRKLCELVDGDFQKTPTNAAVLKAVVEARPPDPIVTHIFYSDVVVLDRKGLRAQLGELQAKNGKKSVLLVRGGKQTGKSWSQHVFLEMARSNGAETVYLTGDLVATVEETIEKIFSALGKTASDIPPKQTTDDAWYRAACNRIHVLASTETKKPLWIAMDDLGPTPDGTPLLDPKIKDFFDHFALNMINPAFQKWFRLMLMHYPEGVPTRWKKEYWAEDIAKEEEVQQAEVTEALLGWAKWKRLNVADAQLEALAAKTIAVADNPQPGETRPRLERIHDGVLAAIKELLKGVPS